MDGQTIAILVLAAVGTAVISTATVVVRRRRERDGAAAPPGAGTPGTSTPPGRTTGGGWRDDDAADTPGSSAGERGRPAARTGATAPPLILGIVRWFRPRGFFADATGTDEQVAAALAARIVDEWGVPLEELADDQQAADMHVLAFDEGRVYQPGAKHIHRGDGTYAEVVERAAALAPAAFPVHDVVERWDGDDGPIHVTYRVAGAEHRFTTAADRYLDASIVLHLDLAADDPEVRLRVCDHLGMPDFVIALDDATADALRRDRGWRFWDDPATDG